MYLQALGGDLAVAKLVLSYTPGKPDRPVDPDTLDQHEWQIHRCSTAPGEWVDLRGGGDPAVALKEQEAVRDPARPSTNGVKPEEGGGATTPGQEPPGSPGGGKR